MQAKQVLILCDQPRGFRKGRHVCVAAVHSMTYYGQDTNPRVIVVYRIVVGISYFYVTFSTR